MLIKLDIKYLDFLKKKAFATYWINSVYNYNILLFFSSPGMTSEVNNDYYLHIDWLQL